MHKYELFRLKYIFEESDKDSQLIVSTIGFLTADFEEEKFDNVIELSNDKYELLNIEDYENYKELCKELVLINEKKTSILLMKEC